MVDHFALVAFNIFKNEYKSVEARRIIDFVSSPGCPPTDEHLQMVNEIESNHIRNVFWNLSESTTKVNNAHFIKYCKVTNSVTIEIKHTECKRFWIQIDISLEQLRSFVIRELNKTLS